MGHFFENGQGEAVSDRYRAMLNEFLFTKIEEEDIDNILFQQDGATCHTAEATLDVLCPVLEERTERFKKTCSVNTKSSDYGFNVKNRF